VFKLLSPTPVSGRSMAAIFGSRSLAFVCSVIVSLLGFLGGASAQDKPADSQPSATVATGQTQSGDSAQTQTTPVVDAAPEQRLVHIVPYGRGTSASPLKNTFAPAGAHLTYFGGPVISNVHVVIVFWGTNVDPVVTTPGTIDQFFADITSSRYYDLLTEYSTVGVTGAGPSAKSSNQTIGRGQFDATVTIIPSACPGPTTCTLSDNQIQAELTSQLAAGHLPAPVKDAQGIIETFYMIYFPPGVHINLGTAPSCAAGGFCAYHSNTSSLVPYGVLPDFGPTSGCQAPHCGSGTEFQNITAVTSHEMAEAVTDAQVGSATVLDAPLAWYDPSPPPTPDLGEVADICGGQDVFVTAGANTYMVQREFSNLQGDCVFTPPIFDLSLPTAVAPNSSFNATLTVRTTAGNFTTPIPGYTGTVHFTSSDAGAILPADYTFTATDAGAHTFSFTLNTLGNQTISVIDTHSSGFNGTATTNVNTNADMVVSKSHVGDFFFGRTGTYTITVSNNGQGPTNAAVSVTDTLPTGLTANSISGTGWNCVLATLTCTRNDALARGSSYPAITLVANVASNAPSFVVNNVVVSGGGETNTANDTANDPTNIVPPPVPDLTITKSHVGPRNGNFFQGETGATYTITVSNIGSLATSGTVSVVDTPPAGQLTATAISGTGWTCALATLTCTRSDALAVNASYPSITLTVNVAIDAPPTLTNTATVSGGGETNTLNDVVGDFTGIEPPPGPDLTVTQSHINPFLLGRTGDYTLTASNVGTTASSGTVSISYSLAAGLTAAAMSGTGWTCNLNTVSCTRSDALAVGGSYPSVTLTVNVALNAPSSSDGTVTVSGGGDVSAVNNSFTDFTLTAAPLVDFLTQVSSPTGFFQGQTGGNLVIFIFNSGNIPSSGTVTVNASLPPGITATAISGTGWNCTLSNLTCTRSDSLSPGPGFPNINVTVNVAGNAPSNLLMSATLTGGGDGNPANNTGGALFPITPAVQVTNLGPGSASVTAGQSSVFSFQVVTTTTAGAVAFSCTGLPSGSACSFNPATIPAVTSITSVGMTVSTTARSATTVRPLSFPGNRVWLAMLLLSAWFIVWIKLLPGRRGRFKPVLALSGIIAALSLVACGGGGNASNPPPPVPSPTPITSGTPAGTYSVTMTATGASTGTATQVFTLVVK
jgi:uncharacterized repeat protein (TIGR01451 family)